MCHYWSLWNLKFLWLSRQLFLIAGIKTMVSSILISNTLPLTCFPSPYCANRDSRRQEGITVVLGILHLLTAASLALTSVRGIQGLVCSPNSSKNQGSLVEFFIWFENAVLLLRTDPLTGEHVVDLHREEVFYLFSIFLLFNINPKYRGCQGW